MTVSRRTNPIFRHRGQEVLSGMVRHSSEARGVLLKEILDDWNREGVTEGARYESRNEQRQARSACIGRGRIIRAALLFPLVSARSAVKCLDRGFTANHVLDVDESTARAMRTRRLRSRAIHADQRGTDRALTLTVALTSCQSNGLGRLVAEAGRYAVQCKNDACVALDDSAGHLIRCHFRCASARKHFHKHE